MCGVKGAHGREFPAQELEVNSVHIEGGAGDGWPVPISGRITPSEMRGVGSRHGRPTVIVQQTEIKQRATEEDAGRRGGARLQFFIPPGQRTLPSLAL